MAPHSNTTSRRSTLKPAFARIEQDGVAPLATADIEVVPHSLRALIPILRGFGEEPHDETGQLLGNGRQHRRWRTRHACNVRMNELYRIGGLERRSPDEERLIGRGDGEVLERATALNRIVVTHDLAFGKVAIRGGASFVGIVYLRPGHISASFVLAMIDALRESSIDVQPPFMVVAERRQTTIRVRARTAPPW